MVIITIYDEMRGVFGEYSLVRRSVYVGENIKILWKRMWVIV